jgi:hypothetical protein
MYQIPVGLCIGAAGGAAADARDTATTAPAEDSGAGRSYKLQICCFSTSLETLCCGIGGGLELVELQATHSGAPVADWRRRAAAPVNDLSRRTLREPAARVMGRPRSGQSSDSESLSLCTAGLEQPAGPRHSPAQTGERRGTSEGHGWIGSEEVEITGSQVGWAATLGVQLREF